MGQQGTTIRVELNQKPVLVYITFGGIEYVIDRIEPVTSVINLLDYFSGYDIEQKVYELVDQELARKGIPLGGFDAESIAEQAHVDESIDSRRAA